ncbi:MAG: hypothetical protein JW958_14140 [Candidatus Eisenbacteria bacterium]|nr:hypothetical protein [Candidatus Eisenbacteria bacterium]
MKRTIAALLAALLLVPPVLAGTTRIEGEYQLQLDIRKQDRPFAWDFESNNGDTWAASQFRIFSVPRPGVEAFVKVEADWNPYDNMEEDAQFVYRESHMRFLKQFGDTELDAYLFHRQDRFWVENHLIRVVDPNNVKDGDNAQGFRFDLRRWKGFDATYIMSDFSNNSKVGGGTTEPSSSDDAHIFRLRRSFLGGALRTGMTYNRKVEGDGTERGFNEVYAIDLRGTLRDTDLYLEYADSRRENLEGAPDQDGFHLSDVGWNQFARGLPRDAALKAELRALRVGTPRYGFYNIVPSYYYYGPDFADYLGDGTNDLVGYYLNSWYLLPKRAITFSVNYGQWEKSFLETKRKTEFFAEIYTEYVNGFTSKIWYARNKTVDFGNPLQTDVTKNYDLFAEVQVESRLAWMRVQGKLKDLETDFKKELVSVEAAVNITPHLKVYNRYAFGNDPARLRKGLFTELQYRPQQNMELFLSYGPFWIGDDAIPVNDGDLSGGADNKDMVRLILKGNF